MGGILGYKYFLHVCMCIVIEIHQVVTFSFDSASPKRNNVTDDGHRLTMGIGDHPRPITVLVKQDQGIIMRTLACLFQSQTAHN